MNKMVKDVFLVLMGVIVALILYYIFFGATNWTGNKINEIGSGTQATYRTDGQWMGLISYMSASVELSLSRYYYDYCYIPSVHSNDAIDIDLVRGDDTDGITVAGTNSTAKVNKVNQELYGLASSNAHLSSIGMFYSALDNTKVFGDNDLVVDTSKVDYYATGWY